MTDLAPVSDFSADLAPTVDVAFSGREERWESTGNPSGAYDNGMHADQTTATDVFSRAPVGAPTFATWTTPGFVGLHEPPSDLLTEITAPPPESNEPATDPSLPHITDSLIYEPGRNTVINACHPCQRQRCRRHRRTAAAGLKR